MRLTTTALAVLMVMRKRKLQGGDRLVVLFFVLDRAKQGLVTHSHDLVEAGLCEAGKSVSMVMQYLRERNWITTEASVWRKLRSLRIEPTVKAAKVLQEVQALRVELDGQKEVAA